MVTGSLSRHARQLKSIFNVLVIIFLQLYISEFVYAVTQNEVEDRYLQNNYIRAVDQAFPEVGDTEKKNAQQKGFLVARNCRTVREYRKKCSIRYIKRRRCRNYRVVKRICKRKPVQRRVCSVRAIRVRRCRGPLGQRECKIITKRKRTCIVRTAYVTSCKKVQRTKRRCRQIRTPRKICHRKVYRKRRCSNR